MTGQRASMIVVPLFGLLMSFVKPAFADPAQCLRYDRTDYPVGDHPISVAIGDLDGDGDLDVASAGGGTSDAVSLLSNNGDGTFEPRGSWEVGHSPWTVVIADLDSRNNLDMVTAGRGAATITVLKSTGAECTTGADCDDGDACTNDICDIDLGICVHVPVPTWDQANECCNALDGSEDPLVCPIPNLCLAAFCTLPGNRGDAQCGPRLGEACDDRIPCTFNDICQADGTCEGTNVDAAQIPCMTPADCQAATGVAYACVNGFCRCEPPPPVACCIPGGACQMLTLEECTAQGGASYSPGDCVGTVSVHGVNNCWDYLNPSLPSGVPVNLGAGPWVITVTRDADPNDGYNYDAYSPWDCDTCNPAGVGAGAWEWTVDAIHEDGHYVLHGWRPTPTPYYLMQGDALAANIGGSTLIHLDAPATVYFGIGDIICGDNRGGVTVSVCRPFMCEGDVDQDGLDGTCGDLCPSDPNKVEPGICGCGVSDADSDGDTVPDCHDLCPGQDDLLDTNGNGMPDCLESQPIPTVSEWGLVVLTLLLLTGSKIAFGRRRWAPI
jgi:hypothetical protein